MVMVHGAWQGAWSFDAWRPSLSARGWTTHALDLPGNGWPPHGDQPASLQAYADTVIDHLSRFAEPVVLVAHSGGGIVATEVAERVPHRLRAVVYLAGMMLPSGMSFRELIEQVRSTGSFGTRSPSAQALDAQAPDTQALDTQVPDSLAGIAPLLEWNADRSASRVPPQAALSVFLHDCPPEAAQRAAGLLRWQPESGRAICGHWTAARAGSVPRVYVECTRDRSVSLPLQTAMQMLTPGAHRISLDCGHVPQLAMPEVLTEWVHQALGTLLAS